jgi:hypothetical protein
MNLVHNNMNSTTASNKTRVLWRCALFGLGLFSFSLVGCQSGGQGTYISYPTEPRPLGSIVDQMNELQEHNAERAKLVIYNHEFELNKPEWEHRLNRPYDGPPRGFRLTPSGQDHVRQIASILAETGEDMVVIERNQTSLREATEYKYSVHYGDKLDLERREIVVQALESLGVPDAKNRVIVAPAFSEGLESAEAASAYAQSFGRANNQGSGGNSGGGGANF